MLKLSLVLVCLLLLSVTGVATSTTVYVEDSPAAGELLHDAQQLVADGRVVEASMTYQKVIDGYGRKLVTLPTGGYSDARSRTMVLIRSDSRVLAAYRDAHRASAERLASRVGTGRADTAALREVLHRFALCESGLSAALHLAAIQLEAGSPERAIALLDRVKDHPDLHAHRVRWDGLQAAAGLYANDLDLYKAHLNALEEGDGHTDLVDRLRRWASSLRLNPDPPALTSRDILPLTKLPGSLGVPLWTMAMETSPTQLADQLSFRRTARRRRAMRPLPDGYAALPTAVEGRLYTNDAGTVYALDSSSGRVVWRYRSDAFDDPSYVQRVARQLTQIRNDSRGVCVHRDRIVTVLGYGIPQRGNNPNETNRTTLVCLRRDDGAELWKLNPVQLDSSLASAMFHGTPIIWSDYVVVMMSRTQTSGFAATYAVALHASSGKPVWWRHLWSQPARRGARNANASMTLDGSDLYITDNRTAAVKIANVDGAIRWLQPLPSKQPPEQKPSRRGNKIQQPPSSAPVVTDAGLAVLTQDPEAPVVLLDKATGATIRKIKQPSLQGSYYLHRAPGGVLAVGPSVTFFNDKDFGTRWARRLEQPFAVHPRYRAAVTSHRVLFPGKRHLVVIDLADGKTLSVSQIESSGHVLALPQQVLVSGNNHLQSYQAWEQAHQHLAAQIRERPKDPLPALALAHISLAADRRAIALAAVDQAIAALALRAAEDEQRSDGHATLDQLQRRVFRQVLKFVQSGQHTDPAVRLRLFERLATLAHHPADRVAYRLALGDSLSEDGQYQEAVARYQQIIQDRELAVQIYDLGDGLINAEFEARRRISQLITQYGREVYAKHESQAAQRVVELSAQGRPDPSAYMRVARTYPFARSSLVATIAAADVFTQREDHQKAAVLLRRAYRQTKEVGLLQRIVGRLAQAHARLGEPRRAANLLRRAQRDYGSLRPLRDGRPVSIDQWLAELESTDPNRAPQAPLIGQLTGESITVNEHMLVSQTDLVSSRTKGLIFTIDRMTLRLRAGPQLQERWRYELPNRQVSIVSITDDQALLRCGVPGVLIALDIKTGKPLWPALSVQDLLMVEGKALAESVVTARQTTKRVIVPVKIEPFVVPGAHAQVSANESIVCVSGASGLLVGVDRATGEVSWRYVNPKGPPRKMLLNEQVVVIDTQSQGQTVRRSGSVLVIDAVTGEPWYPPIDGRQQIRWIGVGEDELMVVATTNRVVAYDLYTGRVRWWLPFAGMPSPAGGVVSDDLVMVQLRDQVNSIYVLDPKDGSVVNRVLAQASQRWQPIFAQRVDDQWQVVSGARVVALGEDGRLLWMDAVQPNHSNRSAICVVGQKHVYLVTTDSSRRGRGRAKRNAALAPKGYVYDIHRLDRRTGRLLEEYQIRFQTPVAPNQAIATEHGIVFTSSGRTTLLSSTH